MIILYHRYCVVSAEQLVTVSDGVKATGCVVITVTAGVKRTVCQRNCVGQGNQFVIVTDCVKRIVCQ